ncbi:MAG: hypothetical protein EXS12_07775 [Phycisphaerales bacterium]|nr:hypothetical protein [Phycisphaerales bacterium]
MNDPDQRNAVVDVSFEVAAPESALLLEPAFRAAAAQPLKTAAHTAICIENLKTYLQFGRMFFTLSW